MITEVADSLGPGVRPGAVLVSVGGGGLLCGVIQGLKNVGWTEVPVIAMETVGADCFNAAVKAGRMVTLEDITRLEVKGAQMFSWSCECSHADFILACLSTVRLIVLVQRQFARKPLNTAKATS